jgi:HEAT repeat protein
MDEVQAWLAELSSGDAQRAEAAAQRPPEDTGAALDGLAALLAEGDADRRWWAARALAEFEDPQAGELLVQALGDNEIDVRHCAALSLRRQPHGQAIPHLVKLLGDKDSLLARLAGDALAAQGKPATPALLEALGTGNEAAQVGAARALAQIGDLRSVSALFKLLDSDSAMLEHWASTGLEAMGVGMSFFAAQ